MWRWWAPGQSRHLQPLRRDTAATPPLRRDAAAYVFRHIGSERGVQWAILTLQDSPDFAAQARHVSEHFEIQAADDAQVELDIQREVWRAEQAPRWFAAAERRRAAARAARAFAAQSRRSRAPRQSGQRADPPSAPALSAASPATDAEVDVAAGASAQETSDALVTPPAAASRAPPILPEPPARRPALGPARRGLPWARWLLAAVALLAVLLGLGARSPSLAALSTAWPASAPVPSASTNSTRSPSLAELPTAWPASAPAPNASTNSTRPRRPAAAPELTDEPTPGFAGMPWPLRVVGCVPLLALAWGLVLRPALSSFGSAGRRRSAPSGRSRSRRRPPRAPRWRKRRRFRFRWTGKAWNVEATLDASIADLEASK